jgi:hypothetical protein
MIGIIMRNGAPTRFKGDVKEAMLKSFHAGGSQKWLTRLMFEHPAVYASLLGKLIPVEVAATVNHNLIDLGAAMIIAQKRIDHQPMVDITPELAEIATADDLSD